MRTAVSTMRAEASVLSVHHQLVECGTRQMNEGGMVTTFKVNIGLSGDAVVNRGVNPICFTDGRHSAELAVGEEPRDFLFCSQCKIIIDATFRALSIPVVATPAALQEDNPGLLLARRFLPVRQPGREMPQRCVATTLSEHAAARHRRCRFCQGVAQA